MELVLQGPEYQEGVTTVFFPKMHWVRVPVLQMLSVLAGKPLSSGHIGGRMPFVARFWTIDQMVVWKVVGAGPLVVAIAMFAAAVTIAVCASAGVVVIGGRIGAGGLVLLVIVPVVLAGSGGSGAGRVGSVRVGITGGVDVMVDFVVFVHFVG